VPFTVQIPPAERDKKLMEKLQAEWPAILRWALDGCLEWQRIGLQPPAIVTEATNKYFEAEDAFGQWIEDECDADPGNGFKWDAVSEFFEAWTNYATKNGDKPGDKKAFNELMTGRGFEACRKGTPAVRAFSGIRLKPRTADWSRGNQRPDE
jgi:putative DNA primase/helicase